MATYEYSCRKCPIRNRCIDESSYTTSTKNMIRIAFDGRTDTLATWGLLQINCLLVKADEEQKRKAGQESLLRRRLREARQDKERAAKTQAKLTGKRKTSPIRRLPQARRVDENKPEEKADAEQVPDYLQPVSLAAKTEPLVTRTEPGPEATPQTIGEVETSPLSSKTGHEQARPCWLTVKGSGRHIMLPVNGEVVLGRFDATFGVPPDVDLAYEDGEQQTVSRRHAKIVGVSGYHTIEDVGSRYGVFVNGEQVKFGKTCSLKPGDGLMMGDIQMFYDEVPPYLLNISEMDSVRYVLLVTPTGRKITLEPSREIIIGRSDRYVDFIPDIDLGQEGDVASRVSRRHATIYWRNDTPYLEDLGSGFGTRLNGQIMLLGQARPLKPGDHIWLGGCVLAYDVERK